MKRGQNEEDMVKEVDVRGLACPGPVIELRQLLDGGATEIRMVVGDELARSNVSRFAASRGADVGSVEVSDGGFAVTIRAADAGAATATGGEEGAGQPVAQGPTVVQIAALAMGCGDDELGALLMRSFVKTLLQVDRAPDVIVFYNGGVHLCCEDSVVLDDLLELDRSGVEIVACGTCLSYYDRADALRVGRVTDMLEIVSLIAAAGRVIRP
jgi:selenium metabolism protein YedF